MAGKLIGSWVGIQNIVEGQYTCAHCGSLTGSSHGWAFQIVGQAGVSPHFVIRVCQFCKQPTYIRPDAQFPAPAFGEVVQGLPKDVGSLYQEARDCTGANAFTPAVLACRKILMHIAVERGAEEGLSFMQYVQYLAEKGYVPPNGKGWVDHIRKRSNDANHQIVLMGRPDAEDLIAFVGLLLKFIYEFPNRVRSVAPAPAAGPSSKP